jgi:hydrogenase expression/formation protein HypC
MCLGDLGQVLEVGAGPTALVQTGVRTVTISLLTLDEPVGPGDWLVCHSGFALRRVTPEEARQAAVLRTGGQPETTTTSTTKDRQP